jgi:4-hydroxyacetophenone monooxygenase
MPSSPPAAPITEDDEAIRAALVRAAVAPLLPAVAQVTGDLALLRDDLRPDPARALEPEGGLTEEQLAEAREILFHALCRFRDGGSQPVARPTDDHLHDLMAFLVGDENVDPYFGVLREELAIDGEDRRAPTWHKQDIAPDVPFTVAIIGAGMSGIVAAHRLHQAGVPFVIFEKNSDVGGTWFENTYPGCRVDVANHLYSYSFAQQVWPQHFSAQATLLDYFRRCVDDLDLRSHVRFGTEVLGAEFSDARATWLVRVLSSAGTEDAVEVQAVISAVGQLNRPSFPDIEGRDDFEGTAFHSARWDAEVDLRGQRVAVIGTGASAAQFIPPVADQASELYVFQRTPNWLIPSPDYHDDVSPELRWLLDHVPSYAQWLRLWLFWRTHEGMLPAARVDRTWQPQDRSVSAINDVVRQLLTGYLRAEFEDDPDLLERVLPSYPPIAKRVIRDNGIWARTLRREHVHLVTEPIDRMTPTGIATTDGVEREVDVVIYGTGFQASRFLTPMRVVGRGGADLHERWAGDARAYLGITVPGFPNLFCLYGPNTNIVINGSIVYFSECGTDYILGCIRHLLEHGHRTLECVDAVHDAFNDRIDKENRQMAWGASSVHSWYKNDKGRVAQNWPFSLLEYWERTRAPEPADYEWR